MSRTGKPALSLKLEAPPEISGLGTSLKLGPNNTMKPAPFYPQASIEQGGLQRRCWGPTLVARGLRTVASRAPTLARAMPRLAYWAQQAAGRALACQRSPWPWTLSNHGQVPSRLESQARLRPQAGARHCCASRWRTERGKLVIHVQVYYAASQMSAACALCHRSRSGPGGCTVLQELQQQ